VPSFAIFLCLFKPIDKDLTTHRANFNDLPLTCRKKIQMNGWHPPLRGGESGERGRPLDTHTPTETATDTDTPAAKMAKSTMRQSGKEGLGLVGAQCCQVFR